MADPFFNLSEHKTDIDAADKSGAWVNLPCGLRVLIRSNQNPDAFEVVQRQSERLAPRFRAGEVLTLDERRENNAEILETCLLGWDGLHINNGGGEPSPVEYSREMASSILRDPTNELFLTQLNDAVTDRNSFRIGTEGDLKN